MDLTWQLGIKNRSLAHAHVSCTLYDTKTVILVDNFFIRFE